MKEEALVKIDSLNINYQSNKLGNIQLLEIKRDSTKLSNPITFSLKFKNLNEIPLNEKIIINIIESNQLIFDINKNIQCINLINNSALNCKKEQEKIVIYNPCNNGNKCNKETIFNISITGLKNIDYNMEKYNENDSIGIFTTYFNSFIDGIYKNIIVKPFKLGFGNIKILNISSTNLIVNKDFLLKIVIKTENFLKSFLRIKFGIGFFFESLFEKLICRVNSIEKKCEIFKENNFKSFYEIIIEEFISQDNNSLIEISGLKNVNYQKNFNDDFFEISTFNYDFIKNQRIIDKEKIDMKNLGNIKPEEIKTLDVFSSSPFISNKNNLYFVFENKNPFKINSIIEIIFPNNFFLKNFSKSEKKCQVIFGLNKNLECELKGNILKISSFYLENNNNRRILSINSLNYNQIGINMIALNNIINTLISQNFENIQLKIMNSNGDILEISNLGYLISKRIISFFIY